MGAKRLYLYEITYKTDIDFGVFAMFQRDEELPLSLHK